MRYHKVSSFEEAAEIGAASKGVTRFLAGGTDVLVQMRAGIVQPDDLIDIKSVQCVNDITQNEDGSWRIGVAVSGARLGRHLAFKSEWPGIVEAVELIGSTQVQSRATMVGNLCNGSPAADSIPALVAANAQVEITSITGNRNVSVVDIPVGPGKTILQRGEVVSAVLIPPRGENGGDAYLRFIPRTEMDIAVVGCAVSLQIEGDIIKSANISLGAVSPTILLVPDAAQAIIGTTLDSDAIEKLSRAAEAACNPIDDKRGTIEFRREVAGVLAKRAAKIAYKRAKGAL